MGIVHSYGNIHLQYIDVRKTEFNCSLESHRVGTKSCLKSRTASLFCYMGALPNPFQINTEALFFLLRFPIPHHNYLFYMVSPNKLGEMCNQNTIGKHSHRKAKIKSV